MSDLREAAKLALIALENGTSPNLWLSTKENLRQALAQPEWVGLTDEEGAEIWGDAHDLDWKRTVTPKEIVKRIEAKLKEKNT